MQEDQKCPMRETTIRKNIEINNSSIMGTMQVINARVFSVSLDGFSIETDNKNSNIPQGKLILILKDLETETVRGHLVIIFP